MGTNTEREEAELAGLQGCEPAKETERALYSMHGRKKPAIRRTLHR
ncbi:hypothetical protein KNP414_06203 [Paenibacillus mucilaginosus KNP414]|uniref:Uncharacterized protein n=1 Tax=Paenibacillus mucilaginosus (strain KNP414) TaxID=1036673 RepID=F8FII3_PAEMK|nr:hypothetical protein KNP414_06203 [Paenibacillus mucilaginosus KNP414]